MLSTQVSSPRAATKVLQACSPLIIGGVAKASQRTTRLFNHHSHLSKLGEHKKRDFFTIIPQGFVAYRLFLGRNPQRLDPGFHINLPVIHTLLTVDLREHCLSIPDLHACTKDNVPVVISGSLFYKVHNPYNCCFQVEDFELSVQSVGTSAVRSVIGKMAYDDVISDRVGINNLVSEAIGTATMDWGVECKKFEIQRFEPQNKEVQRQLELQMEAERRRRQQELDTRAKINIAEGDRQSAILKSEGEMQALKNQADAEFYQTQKHADAERYAKQLNAEGWSQQLDLLAARFGGDSVQAAQFLLELKRWEAMSKIAESPSNSTYFIPDSKNLIPIVAPNNNFSGASSIMNSTLQELSQATSNKH